MGSPTSFPVLGLGRGPRPPGLSCEVTERSRFKKTTDKASNCQGKLVFCLKNLVCELRTEIEEWKRLAQGRSLKICAAHRSSQDKRLQSPCSSRSLQPGSFGGAPAWVRERELGLLWSWAVVGTRPTLPPSPFPPGKMKPKQGIFWLLRWVSPSSGSSGSWSPLNEPRCLGMPFPQGRQLPLHSCTDLWW